VSALINAQSHPGRVVEAWRQGVVEAVGSDALLAELADVLSRDSLQRYIQRSSLAVKVLLEEHPRNTVWVVPTEPIDVVTRDPDDNRVLEAAVTGQVDSIVSGDRHLLDLGVYAGIPIMTPLEFLATIGQWIQS
jgi:putative PIN family toxin of toxin-antitoxin system